MASKLRQVREGEGLSRAALARAAGLSERTIKRIEDEEADYAPTVVTKNKLRNGLNQHASSGQRYALNDLFSD